MMNEKDSRPQTEKVHPARLPKLFEYSKMKNNQPGATSQAERTLNQVNMHKQFKSVDFRN